MSGTWAVARTKSRQENVARDRLKQQGFESYLPMYLNKLTLQRAILFPGYIFVKVVDEWRVIKSTIGILDVLTCGDKPSILHNYEMDRMRSRETEDGLLVLDPYKVGQSVLVKRGPAKDQLGIFDGMTAKDRCRVMLGWLRTEISVRDLIAA